MCPIIRVVHVIEGQRAAYMMYFEKVCMVLDSKSFPISSFTESHNLLVR